MTTSPVVDTREGAAPEEAVRAGAWSALLLLCLMAAVSFLDRHIVALMAQPISRELQISDTQIGLMIGVGFGLFYAIVGVPLARLLDRGHRVRIVFAGVAIWSACTAASGFAPGYGWLMASRVGVALGEAVLTPAAISLIPDLFPRRRLTLPTSIYMAVTSLMGSGAFALGGLAYRLAGAAAPGLGMSPWRLTLVLVGLPGLLLAPLWLLTVREPPRRPSPLDEASYAALGAAAGYIWRRRAFYVPLFLGLGVSAIGSYGYMSWAPTVLVRSFGFSVSDAGYAFGTLGLLAAASASAAWPAASLYLARRGRQDGLVTLLAFALAAGQLGIASLTLLDAPTGFLAVATMTTFCLAAAGALPVLAIQAVAPAEMRATVVSLYVLSGNLIGLVFGPPLAAAIAGRFFHGPDAIRSSLSIVGAVLCPAVLMIMLLARRGYREAVAGT